MFKFDRIESRKNSTRNMLIDSIVTKMRLTLQKDVSLKELALATFIITKEEERGTTGGACLFKKDCKDIQGDVKDLIPNLPPYQTHVWECSGIFFDTLPLTAVENALLLHAFYRELYKELVKFGKIKGIGFVIMKLTAEIYTSSKKFGLWPYIVEIKSENLFHGILPLGGSAYAAYQKLLENMEDGEEMKVTENR